MVFTKCCNVASRATGLNRAKSVAPLDYREPIFAVEWGMGGVGGYVAWL